MKQWKTLLSVAAILLAGWVLYLMANGGPEMRPSGLILAPDDRQIVANGATLYAINCASCHGDNLKGQVEDWRTPGPDGLMPAPPHDETGHTWHHAETLLFEITKLGVGKAAGGRLEVQ